MKRNTTATSKTVKTVNYTKSGKISKAVVSSHVNMNVVLAIGAVATSAWLRVAYLILAGN
jgi:hypothetical protein